MDYPLDQLFRFFASLHAEHHSQDRVLSVCRESPLASDNAAERLIQANPLAEYLVRAIELLRKEKRPNVLEGQLIGLERQYIQNYAQLLGHINEQMEQIAGQAGPTPSRKYS